MKQIVHLFQIFHFVSVDNPSKHMLYLNIYFCSHSISSPFSIQYFATLYNVVIFPTKRLRVKKDNSQRINTKETNMTCKVDIYANWKSSSFPCVFLFCVGSLLLRFDGSRESECVDCCWKRCCTHSGPKDFGASAAARRAQQ